MFKLDLEKAEEPEIKLPTNICLIIDKAREFQKKYSHMKKEKVGNLNTDTLREDLM